MIGLYLRERDDDMVLACVSLRKVHFLYKKKEIDQCKPLASHATSNGSRVCFTKFPQFQGSTSPHLPHGPSCGKTSIT